MSTGLEVKSLKVGGSTLIDASVNTFTDSVKFGRGYEWSIIAVKTGVDNDPEVEIEISADNINFVNPYFGQGNPNNPPPLIITLDELINVFYDSIIPFKWFRLKTVPNGTTTGTLSYKLTTVISS